MGATHSGYRCCKQIRGIATITVGKLQAPDTWVLCAVTQRDLCTTFANVHCRLFAVPIRLPGVAYVSGRIVNCLRP